MSPESHLGSLWGSERFENASVASSSESGTVVADSDGERLLFIDPSGQLVGVFGLDDKETPITSATAIHQVGSDVYVAGIKHAEDGKAIKAGLVSTDLVEYLMACEDLSLALDDGGHTSLSYGSSTSLLEDKESPVFQEFSKRVSDPNNVLGVYYNSKADGQIAKQQVSAERMAARDKAYNGQTYIKKGDTAVIVFDAFSANDPAWRDYFAGKGERPNTTDLIPAGDYKGMVDAVAIASEGLERAKADPEVRNVVLDISNNGGGSLDVLEYIASAVCGRKHFQWQNTLTGQLEKEYFDVDRNLDGVFDEKDDAVDYSGLNFAVLTSRSSFSCGNLLPSVLADEGIMVMGERSGGGSCAVGRCVPT